MYLLLAMEKDINLCGMVIMKSNDPKKNEQMKQERKSDPEKGWKRFFYEAKKSTTLANFDPGIYRAICE
ncbi:hypothetical protein ABK041_25780 [Pseudomonas aeruginosa]|uniref:hypothetical protein n=1 Tax=Pseudomonas aeruginosa TaxID=287 RepID=UPI0032E47D47